jgi:hypothetical protein
MLIVSKFKDYYDTAIGFGGIDKSIVYNRSSVDLRKEDFKQDIAMRDWEFSLKNKQPSYVWPFIIGFCGKIYLGYKYIEGNNLYEYSGEKSKYFYGEDIMILVKFLEKINQLDRYSQTNERDIRNLIDKYHGKPYDKLFVRYRVPSFISTSSKGRYNLLGDKELTAVLNPRLKDYEFMKIFDAFGAFQEIETFFGGVIGRGENPTVVISDIDRLESKGFDKKWSFRNPDPPKRKQK